MRTPIDSNGKALKEKIRKERELRVGFLCQLYELVEGDTSRTIALEEANAQSGIGKFQGETICQFLSDAGLIRMKENNLQILHEGVLLAELIIAGPDKSHKKRLFGRYRRDQQKSNGRRTMAGNE